MTKSEICNYPSQMFAQHEIQNKQQQYTGDSSCIVRQIYPTTGDPNGAWTVIYEITTSDLSDMSQYEAGSYTPSPHLSEVASERAYALALPSDFKQKDYEIFSESGYASSDYNNTEYSIGRLNRRYMIYEYLGEYYYNKLISEPAFKWQLFCTDDYYNHLWILSANIADFIEKTPSASQEEIYNYIHNNQASFIENNYKEYQKTKAIKAQQLEKEIARQNRLPFTVPIIGFCVSLYLFIKSGLIGVFIFGLLITAFAWWWVKDDNKKADE